MADPKSPDHEAFGRAVRELRARRGYSQEVLGQHASMHRNYVGAIERGEINPTLRIVLKVASGLDVGLDELVAVYLRQLEDPPPPRPRRRRRTISGSGGADESGS
jgi:transcriptional regulator with XRE-family HTH domain